MAGLLSGSLRLRGEKNKRCGDEAFLLFVPDDQTLYQDWERERNQGTRLHRGYLQLLPPHLVLP